MMDVHAIHEALKEEPIAVVLLFQSHCDFTNSTRPTLTKLREEHKFLLVSIVCDHISPEMAGCALPSVTVFRHGVQTAGPIRGAKTRACLARFLTEAGVIKP